MLYYCLDFYVSIHIYIYTYTYTYTVYTQINEYVCICIHVVYTHMSVYVRIPAANFDPALAICMRCLIISSSSFTTPVLHSNVILTYVNEIQGLNIVNNHHLTESFIQSTFFDLISNTYYLQYLMFIIRLYNYHWKTVLIPLLCQQDAERRAESYVDPWFSVRSLAQ